MIVCRFFVPIASKSFDDSSSASEELFPLLVGALPKMSGRPSIGLNGGGSRVFDCVEKASGLTDLGGFLSSAIS